MTSVLLLASKTQHAEEEETCTLNQQQQAVTVNIKTK